MPRHGQTPGSLHQRAPPGGVGFEISAVNSLPCVWHGRCHPVCRQPAGGNGAPRFTTQPDPSHRRTAASRGACYCGTVQYAIDAALELHARWDCATCSQRPAASFATVMAASATRFRWLQGEEWISSYDSPTLQRSFCRRWGAALPVAVQATGLVFCPADTPGGVPRIDSQSRADMDVAANQGARRGIAGVRRRIIGAPGHST